MRINTPHKILIAFSILFVGFWLPFFVVLINTQPQIHTSIDTLPTADAVVIFGAHIDDDGHVTPLLKERLDAGRMIWNAGKSDTIVVSNTEEAALVMAQYLQNEGVPSDSIEMDIFAETTPDTCLYEQKQHPEGRALIFVSQGFHLPRLLYQCQKIGIEAEAFPAELVGTVDHSEYSFLTKVTTRTSRYIREAGLTWLVILGAY